MRVLLGVRSFIDARGPARHESRVLAPGALVSTRIMTDSDAEPVDLIQYVWSQKYQLHLFALECLF